ncbi:hypothetical protein Tsubulata_023367 [Turnera subulata]|uniref:Sister chromatid cohesion protein DCC1 n=1 Tax=Turnera subulata TaxID=218843 RepID=A0A9Q0F6V9_9ROSI|nr:hypothetical protein Tsubulata_023367 [Turnera subulata]
MEQQLGSSSFQGPEAVLNMQPSSSIGIAYHPLFGSHPDLILLELDDKLLPDLLLHQRVSLRGQPDEDAVLCTQSKTYAIKFVGTSNSALLVPPSHLYQLSQNSQHQEPDTIIPDDGKLIVPIIQVAPGNMELLEVAPRLDKLKLLLSQKPYSYEEALEDMEKDDKTGLYRWPDLVDMVQASNGELENGLMALSALEIDGYWRIVDEEYMDMILRMLLQNSILNEWSLDELDEDEVVSVLVADGFPCNIARHCLHVYGSKVVDGTVGRNAWRLDARRVGVHFARAILRSGKMKMDNFMEEWLRKIPEGMNVSFSMLEGEVLTDKFGVETWVYAFRVSSLPSTPAERFAMLFRERSRWEWKDLEPYIRDLKVPGLSSEGLLLKYTRRTQPTADAEPVFSAR